MRHAQREHISFTGTGTFITRLLESGLITAHDLQRKYVSELHANEIMLLAYYIAAVNIETTYHALAGKTAEADAYEPFPGIVLADTFQISEAGDSMDRIMFPNNNARIEAQLEAPINVIVSNPPYSVGQTDASDLNANVKYPTLDGRIEQTYAKRSTARSQRTLYDSYIRAFRWATDRIGDTGVIGFVSNGGYIDGNTADGMRLSLAEDYSALYVYNLRGNARTSGELRQKEKGNVFGVGSRNTVAIFIGVKDPTHSTVCQVFYRDIGDYLTREDKLRIVEENQLSTLDWQSITPNVHGDWINQRDDTFRAWPVIGDKKADPAREIAVFESYSLGLATGRDVWCYNSSRTALTANVNTMIETYESARHTFRRTGPIQTVPKASEATANKFLDTHSQYVQRSQISWNRNAKQDLAKDREYIFRADSVITSTYRPFLAQHCYFHRDMNAMLYQLPSMFPTPSHKNIGFCLMGDVPQSIAALAVSSVPDLNFFGFGSQFFPRWTYEKAESDDGGLDFSTEAAEVDEYGYRRVDNITDAILALYREAVGNQVTKDDIFYYVYGLLHDPAYRTTYAADLKKMLPHIPTPEVREWFDQLTDAGRRLAELHIGYETVEPYPLEVQLKPGTDPARRETWLVEKMKWRSKTDHSAIVYNGRVTVAGIPEDAERYMLGSRSALAWIIDRYQVKTDKASGIVNDPNDWCDEHDDPTYIVELIKRVTTVAVETMKIVDGL